MLLFKRVPHCYNANHDFKEKWKVRKMSCHIIVTILIESRCAVWSRSKGVQFVRYSSTHLMFFAHHLLPVISFLHNLWAKKKNCLPKLVSRFHISLVYGYQQSNLIYANELLRSLSFFCNFLRKGNINKNQL